MLLLESIMTLFVAAYIATVALGHALLFAALLKYMRETWGISRRGVMPAHGELPSR